MKQRATHGTTTRRLARGIISSSDFYHNVIRYDNHNILDGVSNSDPPDNAALPDFELPLTAALLKTGDVPIMSLSALFDVRSDGHGGQL